MFFIVGSVIVLVSVVGGYMANGGHMAVLWQPFELVIIIGAAVGGFITANRKPVLVATGTAIGALLKAEKYDKASYLELLSLLYAVFKMSKTKGALALEQHVEKPDESTLFAQYPKFNGDHHAVVFLCDYLRLLTLGTDNHHEMETLMDEEIEAHHE
jgi:chemotaxis protein MotA